jgi:hypothetical protein
LDENSQQQINQFFGSIAPWRNAYVRTRLHYLAKRDGDNLIVIKGRIFLDFIDQEIPAPRFQNAAIEAWQCDIDPSISVEQILADLISANGFRLNHGACLKIPSEPNNLPYVSPPIHFHPEGLNNGNRLAVLTVSGAPWTELLPQPQTDWQLRAAEQPFDSIQELANTVGLGMVEGNRAVFEVVAKTVIEVLAKSEIANTVATIGLWMAKSLDRSKARIGYRVLSKGDVVIRAATNGSELAWIEEEKADEGSMKLDVPQGAIVQCFASYEGHTHHVQWRADPNVFQNPRAAVLSLADTQKKFQDFLHPEPNSRGSVATDFEDAIAWLVWTLGFSTVSFGANPRTKDAYDIVAVCPRGDFMVIECTVGLLKAESKLSRLVSRAASLRATLDSSNLRQLKVLPVIVSALTNEQLAADIGAADESKVFVLSREGLDELVSQQYRFPNADASFDRAWQSVQDRHARRHSQTGKGSSIW